jgi:hypothetical protein
LRTVAGAALLAVGCVFGWPAAPAQGQSSPAEKTAKTDRTVLPPPPPEFKGKIGPNYKESTPDFSPALPATAPEGAPNVLVVVLDDVG